jgi:hypothetical protein
VTEAIDNIVRQFISSVNEQVGMYMDALAGFAGHHTRVERQIQRVSLPSQARTNEKGESVVSWTSYEDPTKPDVIHNRIIRAIDYVAANAPGGSNEQQLAKAIVVFLFTYWEDEIHPQLAKAKGAEVKEVRSDIMGDMRILRHAILHAKSVISHTEHRRLKKMGSMFTAGKPIHISYEDMHKIFILIKQDCGRLMLEWLGVKDGPISPEEIRDIAVQKKRIIDQRT